MMELSLGDVKHTRKFSPSQIISSYKKEIPMLMTGDIFDRDIFTYLVLRVWNVAPEDK